MDQHVNSTETETNGGTSGQPTAPALQRRTVLKQAGVAGVGALVGLQSGRARATRRRTTSNTDTLEETDGNGSLEILYVDGAAGDTANPQPISALVAIPGHDGAVVPHHFPCLVVHTDNEPIDELAARVWEKIDLG